MIVLHALWSADSSLLVWGEDSDSPQPRTGRPKAGAARPHPFAAGRDALSEAIEIASGELLPEHAERDQLALLLPTSGPVPLPSPRLAAPDRSTPGPAGSGVCLEPWAVSAFSLYPGDALDLLLRLGSLDVEDETLVGLGDSVRYWIEISRRAVELAAQGRFVPGLERVGDEFVAVWRPAAPGIAAAPWFSSLAEAMPPVCRATIDPMEAESGRPSHPARNRARPRTADAGGIDPGERWNRFTGRSPRLILADALTSMLDAAVCEALLRSPPPPTRSLRRPAAAASVRTPPEEAAHQWLAALGAADPAIRSEPAGLAALERHAREWLAPSNPAGAESAFRTCFRLATPDDGAAANDTADDQWRVEFLLQARDDPSFLIPADQVWTPSAGALRLLQTRAPDPQETLLADLGRARRLYPALGDALRSARPSSLRLDTVGAHTFLRESSPLLEQAGFGVQLPAWLANPTRGLGVKLVSDDHPDQRDSGLGLMGLDAIQSYAWRVSLGDQALDAADFRELAKLKVPLIRVRGEWVELDPAQVQAALRLLEADAPAEMTGMQVLRIASGIDAPPGGLRLNGVEADGWIGRLLAGPDASGEGGNLTFEETPVPASFRGTLRPYQRRGLAWLDFLDRAGIGGILADDMGLGKTPQTLALLARDLDDGAATAGSKNHAPTLLVCPMSLVGNWQREAARFVPDLRVHVHHGSERASGKAFREAVAGADLVVTTYALAARDREELAGLRWRRIVLDEAQNIKNASARQSAAVRSIPAARRIALTGTPVENRLTELWSIFDFLNPGLLGPETAFKSRFAVPIERYRDADAAARLRHVTRPFLLRRVKTDRSIIADLPEKMEMNVLCNLTREQASLYQATVDDMLERIAVSEGIQRRGLVLGALTRLKQICNHPAQFLHQEGPLGDRSGKVARLDEIVEQVLEAGERVLVFTQYAEMGAMLRPHLQTRFGREVIYLHGGTSKRKRDDLVARFQSDGGPPIFLLSLKAGGTGLNLTAANHVIHFDRWWNPAVEDQATDRAYRIGQRRDVQVRKLVCIGTLEERIDEMIVRKRDLAERIVGTGEAWLSELSTNELRELVRLSGDAVDDSDV